MAKVSCECFCGIAGKFFLFLIGITAWSFFFSATLSGPLAIGMWVGVATNTREVVPCEVQNCSFVQHCYAGISGLDPPTPDTARCLIREANSIDDTAWKWDTTFCHFQFAKACDITSETPDGTYDCGRDSNGVLYLEPKSYAYQACKVAGVVFTIVFPAVAAMCYEHWQKKKKFHPMVTLALPCFQHYPMFYTLDEAFKSGLKETEPVTEPETPLSTDAASYSA